MWVERYCIFPPGFVLIKSLLKNFDFTPNRKSTFSISYPGYMDGHKVVLTVRIIHFKASKRKQGNAAEIKQENMEGRRSIAVEVNS